MLRWRRQELEEKNKVVVEENEDEAERLSIYTSKDFKGCCRGIDEEESSHDEETIADLFANNSSKPLLS